MIELGYVGHLVLDIADARLTYFRVFQIQVTGCLQLRS